MSTATATVVAAHLSEQVDRLGALNARIADLKRQADAIKVDLLASGQREIEGSLYRAVVATRVSERLDAATVRKVLTAGQLEVCTTQTSSVSLTLYDR